MVKPARGVGWLWIYPDPRPPHACLSGACSNLHWGRSKNQHWEPTDSVEPGSAPCQLRVMELLPPRLSFPTYAVKILTLKHAVDILGRKE